MDPLLSTQSTQFEWRRSATRLISFACDLHYTLDMLYFRIDLDVIKRGLELTKTNTSKLCDKPWAYWKSSVNWVCNVIISEITDRKLYLTCTINHQVRICHRWYIQDGNVIFMIPTTMTKLRYPLLLSLYPFSYTVSLTLFMMQTILVLLYFAIILFC